MEDDTIVLIAQARQDVPFLGGGLGEKAQRLVGVAGEDDLVEAFGFGLAGMHHRPEGVAADRADRSAGAKVAARGREARLKPADIFHAAAIDRPPLVLSPGRKERVVAEEVHQRAGRKLADPVGRRRPDRAADRHEVVVPEPGAEP
jgi:hypothetical protein